MSPLHSLVGYEVEAESAVVFATLIMPTIAMAVVSRDQLVQRRIARRAFAGLAQLQDVFRGVLRA
jgi:hypothetical protein